MRPTRFAVAFMLATTAASAQAQPSTGDLEARVRALEARVSALESGGGQAAAPAPASNAVRCRQLNVNGSAIAPGSTLTVTVNGNRVGTFDVNAYADLERHMRPGTNKVGLSFAAQGTTGPFGTSAELRCLAPDSPTSRDTILTLQPTRERLSAEVEVEFVPG